MQKDYNYGFESSPIAEERIMDLRFAQFYYFYFYFYTLHICTTSKKVCVSKSGGYSRQTVLHNIPITLDPRKLCLVSVRKYPTKTRREWNISALAAERIMDLVDL